MLLILGHDTLDHLLKLLASISYFNLSSDLAVSTSKEMGLFMCPPLMGKVFNYIYPILSLLWAFFTPFNVSVIHPVCIEPTGEVRVMSCDRNLRY